MSTRWWTLPSRASIKASASRSPRCRIPSIGSASSRRATICDRICLASIRRNGIKSAWQRRSKDSRSRSWTTRGSAIDQNLPMDTAALDNPVWSALSGRHRSIACRLHDLKWYAPSIAPFVAVPAVDVQPDLEAAFRSGLGRQADFVGQCPASLPESWRGAARSNILQLFPTGEITEGSEDAGTVLGEIDRRAMRELTQIAFPDFFRERTA